MIAESFRRSTSVHSGSTAVVFLLVFTVNGTLSEDTISMFVRQIGKIALFLDAFRTSAALSIVSPCFPFTRCIHLYLSMLFVHAADISLLFVHVLLACRHYFPMRNVTKASTSFHLLHLFIVRTTSADMCCYSCVCKLCANELC